MLDQPVGEARAAERVQARGQERADLGGVDVELVDRQDRLLEKLLLDFRCPPLEVAPEEVRLEVQLTLLHARAGEDPLCELVVVQAQLPQGVPLAGQRGPVHDGEAREPGARRPGSDGRTDVLPAVVPLTARQ